MESAVWISITFVFLFNIGGALSSEAFLTLREEPKDTVFITETRREFATFRCNADGYPKPDITWLANDQIIRENSLYSVTEEGTLRISEPTRQLNGSTYRCIANNSFGAVMSKAAILEIAYVDPVSEDPLPLVRINTRLGICISCNPPDAYPGIKVTWNKETDSSFSPNERIRVMMDGRLCFAHSELRDEGTFRCLVSNRYDDGGAAVIKRGSSVRFFVLIGGSNPPQSLTPVPDMQDRVTVRQGQEAVLECFFLGSPTPTLEWSRTVNDLPRSSSPSRYNQTLRIPNAQPEDSGEYLCTATSDGDSGIVHRHLTVLAPPLLVSGLNDKEVDSGTNVNFQCTADSDAVEFSWYHNARLINSSMQRPRISEDNTLTIDNAMVQDSGIYQCAARNVHGMTLSTAQLFVKEHDPTEETPIEGIKQPNGESPGNGAGHTFVHLFSTVVMVSAVLFEVM